MSVVTHQGQQYNVTRQSDDEWRLTSVENPRETIVLSSQQLRLAGFFDIVEIEND